MTNVQQRESWTGSEGDAWVRDATRYDAMNDAFGLAILDAADLAAGQRVLDVGCGNGATTLQAADRVAGGGHVTGIDLSPQMLAMATERAVGRDDVTFVEGDAQVHRFDEGAHDAVISRFGTMFFDDPAAAFANLHRATAPGGRLAIVCWQDALASEWTAVPGGTAAAHLGFPDFGEPHSPGPFGLADHDRLRDVVAAGGYDAIQIEAVTRPMRMGDDVDDVVAFFTNLELVRTWFSQHPEDKVAAAIADVREALAPFAGPDGVVMNGTAWIATARHGRSSGR